MDHAIRIACRRAVYVLLVVALPLAVAVPAHAAFPGQNGKIAFGDYLDQSSAIYPNGSGITLLARGTFYALGPKWSPNGSKFTYELSVDGETTPQVSTANADGSGDSFLGYGITPSWSNDGAKLVFSFDGHLWTMNADGTGRVQIPNTGTSDHSPAWSPDGSKIAFSNGVAIRTINPDGSGLTALTSGPEDREPAWSPDGSKLAFTRRTGAAYGVWTMNADGSAQMQVAPGGFGASWSPDGSKIAYARADRSLHTMNPDGTSDRLVLDEYAGGGTDWQPCPALCPPAPSPYDQPAQAFRLTVSLVPNFRQTISATQCQARGGMPSAHGSPLAVSSCNPPGYVPGTVAHLGAGDRSNVKFVADWGDADATNGNQADVSINGQVNDLRTAAGGPYDPDPSPTGSDISIVAKLRLTDSFNGVSQADSATVKDFEVSVPGHCAPSFTSPGSDCWIGSSVNAVTPGVVTEGKNAVLQVFRARANDSGVNGTRGDADDRTFAVQGIYVP